jgi:hypothetical protein
MLDVNAISTLALAAATASGAVGGIAAYVKGRPVWQAFQAKVVIVKERDQARAQAQEFSEQIKAQRVIITEMRASLDDVVGLVTSMRSDVTEMRGELSDLETRHKASLKYNVDIMDHVRKTAKDAGDFPPVPPVLLADIVEEFRERGNVVPSEMHGDTK